MQAEARGRLAGGGVPDVVDAAENGDDEAVELHFITHTRADGVVDAAKSGDVEAVELHVIADARVVNERDM